MSKIYYFLLLLFSLPAMSMERPHNYKATIADYDFGLNFTQLDSELSKIIGEEKPKPAITPQHIAEKILSETLVSEPKDSQENLESFLARYPHMVRHEEALKTMLESATSITDIQWIEAVLNFYQKHYSAEWISDLHEMAFAALSKKFGAPKLVDLALAYKTPGALNWLSTQKIACQTIPVSTLAELVTDARVAFHHCDEFKTAALLQLLNKTSFGQEAHDAVIRALMANMQTVDLVKNKDDARKKIIQRIHILAHANYNLAQHPTLMTTALKSGLNDAAAMLEQYGLINPNRPCLPFFTPEKPHTNSSVTLEKIYAKKDTDDSSEEFNWSDRILPTKKSSSKYVKFIN